MAAKNSKTDSKQGAPKAVKIPEEMREWCALLRQELESWPQVSSKRMFGMVSFYRGPAIFAAVPHTKAYFSPYSIIFKLQSPTELQRKKLAADSHVNLSFGIGQKWYGYELASPEAIRGALEWMDEAFRAARPAKKSARKRTA